MSFKKECLVSNDDDNYSPTITDPMKIAYYMQLERFKVFKAQDEEKGHFDCRLQIQEKEIYVHKYFLATASETFNAMLSSRWNKNVDGSIKIENPDYTFEAFYDFLCFIYSGTCNFSDENIFILTDMAEFYGIPALKNLCEEYLLKKEITSEDIVNLTEFALKYSLKKLLSFLEAFIRNNLLALIKSENFVKFKKPFIIFLIPLLKSDSHEIFFDAVYKWGEHQASIKVRESKNEQFDVEECIKNELDEILFNIDFTKMRYEFVKESIPPKNFLFSPPELYRILVDCKKKDDQEEECFQIIYRLAKRKVMMKMKENLFNIHENELFEAIKQELSGILKNDLFRQFSYKFLMEFIVPKRLLSKEQVHRLCEVCIKLSYGDKSITGVFEDIYGIKKLLSDTEKFKSFPFDSWGRYRFSYENDTFMKFKIPSTAKPVIKKENVEWYLVLEDNGILAVKTNTFIEQTDFIITEMKASSGGFKFVRGGILRRSLWYTNH